MKPSSFLRTAALLALAACATAPRGSSAPTSGDEVIRAMHGRYAGRWYRTIAFTQKTTFSPPGRPERVETWEEYGSIPGLLRIETGPGRGVIFSGDSTFSIAGDTVARRTKGRNELMTLGFDVYAQPPEATAQQLRENGFATDRFRTDTWQGRPVYVVGAGPGDQRTKQFWVDAERLVFVRMLEPVPNDSVRVQDLRFNNYQRAGGGWVAPEVEIVVDGKRVFHEAYSNIRVDIPLDSSLWIPGRWREARHP
ncbi:MAG TPA: hypothetical protein VF613_07010 [Longimicrobium sp.]|jgi:hypothetical protein